MPELNILNFVNAPLNKIFKGMDKVVSLKDHLTLKETILRKRDLININLINEVKNLKISNLSFEQILLLNLDNFPVDIADLEGMLKRENIGLNQKLSDLLKQFEKENHDVLSTKYRNLLYRIYLIKDEREEAELSVQLNECISYEEWNSLREFPYGLSYLLHSSLNLFQISKNPKNRVYLKQSSERILRKLEIGRDKCIDFSDNYSDNSMLLEQLKIIYFCLLLCQENNDLRFLNAAMKAIDRIYTSVKYINLDKKLDHEDLEVLFLYVLNIERQEKLYEELVRDE